MMDVSTCNFIADFKEKIVEKVQDLKNKKFKLQFNGISLDPMDDLKDILSKMINKKDVIEIRF